MLDGVESNNLRCTENCTHHSNLHIYSGLCVVFRLESEILGGDAAALGKRTTNALVSQP